MFINLTKIQNADEIMMTKIEIIDRRPTLSEFAAGLYRDYGPAKPMGEAAFSSDRPHFFLLRNFSGEIDLLAILNTERCAYQCHFCQLPEKSLRTLIPADLIIEQFAYVLNQQKHALGVIERVTLSNEGSVLDEGTFPETALEVIAEAIGQLRRVKTLVLETRMEYVKKDKLLRLREYNPRATINILTGFETSNEDIRDRILGKREPLSVFKTGLDEVAAAGASLTAYILYKPSFEMTDEEALHDAVQSFLYLQGECRRRQIPWSVRINPMYVAEGSKWAEQARTNFFQPPQLSHVLEFARWVREQGISAYIGLSMEGLESEGGDYRSREDFSHELLKEAIIFNRGL